MRERERTDGTRGTALGHSDNAVDVTPEGGATIQGRLIMFYQFATLIFLAAVVTTPCLAQPRTTPARPNLLIHGNYCGPGNNAPLPPVDALDAACAKHDACTPDGALPSKACNLRLQAEADRIANDPRQSPELRMVAGVVASGAAMMPSAPSGRIIRRAIPGGAED